MNSTAPNFTPEVRAKLSKSLRRYWARKRARQNGHLAPKANGHTDPKGALHKLVRSIVDEALMEILG